MIPTLEIAFDDSEQIDFYPIRMRESYKLHEWILLRKREEKKNRKLFVSFSATPNKPILYSFCYNIFMPSNSKNWTASLDIRFMSSTIYLNLGTISACVMKQYTEDIIHIRFVLFQSTIYTTENKKNKSNCLWFPSTQYFFACRLHQNNSIGWSDDLKWNFNLDHFLLCFSSIRWPVACFNIIFQDITFQTCQTNKNTFILRSYV